MTGPRPTRGDRAVRLSMAAVVIGVATVAAWVSYRHAYDVVLAAGEPPATARLVPLTVDGLMYASSMVMLHCARHQLPVPALARWLLGVGVAATLAANIAHGAGHGPVGAAVAAWPAIALVGSYELLMWVIRSGTPAATTAATGPDIAPATATTPNTPAAARPDTMAEADITPDTKGAPVRPDMPAAMTADTEPATGPAMSAAPATAPATRPDRPHHPDITPATQPAMTGHPDIEPATGPDLQDEAARLVAAHPDITGAALARQLRISERHGRRLRTWAVGQLDQADMAATP